MGFTSQLQRLETREEKTKKKKAPTMKKFGYATVVAGGFTAAVLGLAGPAQADIGHHVWVNEITQPQVSVPHVDTTVQQSR